MTVSAIGLAALVAPATLEQRIQRIRRSRRTARIAVARHAGVWMAGAAALVVVAAASELATH